MFAFAPKHQRDQLRAELGDTREKLAELWDYIHARFMLPMFHWRLEVTA